MPSRLPTIPQLLAVAAIIAFMAAIFVPVFTHDTKKAPQVYCMSQEKQLGLSILQYTQDYGGLMPSFADAQGNSWRTVIYPYVKQPNLFRCPSRELADKHENPAGADGYAQSYAANASGGRGAFNGPGGKPVVLSDVAEPADLIALMETAYNTNPGYDIDNPVGFGPGSKTLWAGHGGRSVYLFLDCHVRALRPLETVRKDSDSTGSVNEWYRNGALPLSSNGVAVLRDAQARFGP